MKRFLILTISVFVFLIGCTDRDDVLDGVWIRVKNVSTLPYDAIQVGDEEMVHTNLASDSYSEYLAYETAYVYAYIHILVGEETYVLQPIDFVGESPLPLGYYTYEVGLDENGDVTLDFVID
ncbi:hypothetical protein [Maribacter polysaccharolyticus]|uniref:hypothetical protein n=1 Tax=Maribacter polysaccharolyticus TaxID=3020831 RepID=UPI00237F9194|nr:hypothetical protein [Maribacter polysaccharolyticus]MDE3743944.1 hypothetical protein [Maribacter polysaccharolyticus]